MLGQNVTRLEALLWSIALPGFGQLLNKKHIKGTFEFTSSVTSAGISKKITEGEFSMKRD